MAFPFFNQILSRIQNLRLSSASPRGNEQRVNLPARTTAGVVVTPDNSLTNDVVWAAHRYLTQTVAQLPAKIFRDGTRGQERVYNQPADRVLNFRPNPELSPFQLRETLTGWAITHGNGVAEIEFDEVGRARWLWPIEPWRLEFERDVSDGSLIYSVDNGPGRDRIKLRPDEVIHIRGFGNGPVGLSVIEYAAQKIGWNQAASIFGAAFFGEGMHFGGTAILPQGTKGGELERIRSELEASFRGPSRAGKWFVGDGDLKVTKMTASPNEGQFVETMQHQVEVICRFMGVPPHKVMHLLRSTFSNIEHQNIEVVGDSIVPWAMRWEQECSYKLFGQNRTNLYIKFEVKALLRGSYKDRQEGLQIQRRNGVLNADEWRGLEDMPPMADGEGGKIYIVEKNMVELNKVGMDLIQPNSSQDPGQDAQQDPGQDAQQDPGAASQAAIAFLAQAKAYLDEVEFEEVG